MYVTCTPDEGGNVYRVHRKSERFVVEVRRLVPFLVEHGFISQVFDGPDALLRIGPMVGQVEREFQATLERAATREAASS